MHRVLLQAIVGIVQSGLNVTLLTTWRFSVSEISKSTKTVRLVVVQLPCLDVCVLSSIALLQSSTHCSEALDA